VFSLLQAIIAPRARVHAVYVRFERTDSEANQEYGKQKRAAITSSRDESSSLATISGRVVIFKATVARKKPSPKVVSQQSRASKLANQITHCVPGVGGLLCASAF
jgi:hypothetical protein